MATSSLAHLTQIRNLAEAGVTREFRIALGLSLPELAAAVHVSPSTIYRWEVGERRPRGRAALRYRAALLRLSGQVAAGVQIDSEPLDPERP